MQDLVLVERAKRGNREALQKIVEKYYQKIYAYIYYRVGNRETAEDLTQETFLRLTRSIHRFVPMAKFSTWLYQIAHNVVVDHLRSAPDLVYEIPEQVQEAKTGQVEQRVDILATLQRLPQEQRECIILYYFQCLRQKEIALILDIPLSTVKTRIRRGLEQCKKIMMEDEDER